MPFIEKITDFSANLNQLAQRRYGVIETHAGKLTQITLRPWPHLLSWREIWIVGDQWRPKGPEDRCRLYYNQPLGHERFLALRYVACTAGTRYATFRAALTVLDAIAELKQSNALLCDAANSRLSDRFLQRMGWEAHAQKWGRRNHIRRFYGKYPGALASLTSECQHQPAVGLGSIATPC